MKLILTGATGFVGNEVLYHALEDANVESVTVLTRRPIRTAHAKLKELVLKDFLDYAPIREHLMADACIWALGVSQTEVTKEEYIRITFDYTLAAARAMFAVNQQMRFCFVSGSGAD
jgi:nucleoside-diphosphate-sugar epimerase